MTKPLGRITAIQQGAGADLDKLNITWEATDNQKLAARPISLSYAETLGGPWNSIAGNIENTGRYTWTIDPRVPQRVHLRLEIRDEAGNVGVFETPEPISIDHAVPSAKIREVHPLGQAASYQSDATFWR